MKKDNSSPDCFVALGKDFQCVKKWSLETSAVAVAIVGTYYSVILAQIRERCGHAVGTIPSSIARDTLVSIPESPDGDIFPSQTD